MTTDIVPVGLGKRSYDIHIGSDLLEQAGALIEPLLRQKQVFIISDENFRRQAEALAHKDGRGHAWFTGGCPIFGVNPLWHDQWNSTPLKHIVVNVIGFAHERTATKFHRGALQWPGNQQKLRVDCHHWPFAVLAPVILGEHGLLIDLSAGLIPGCR